MRVAVIADVHLDTKFAVLGPRAAALRRENLKRALERAVSLALRERADALLIAGDLYEQERFVPDTGRFLARVFEGFSPRPVLIAPGNHDWWGPESLYSLVSWSDNVYVFDSSTPDSFQLEDGLWVWGAAHQAARTEKNFLDGFKVQGSGVHIGLIHGSEVSRFRAEQSDDAEKFAHAPFRESDIERAGLSHLFAGHYHRASTSSLCTYPGNPDPLTFGEDRRENPRGVVFATIDPSGEVRVEPPRDVAVSQVFDVEVNVEKATDKRQLLDAVLDRVDEAAGGNTPGSYLKISLLGRVGSDIDLDSLDKLIASELDSAAGVFVDSRRLGASFDYSEYLDEESVRGEFLRLVARANGLDESVKERIAAAGIAALEGREDLLSGFDQGW